MSLLLLFRPSGLTDEGTPDIPGGAGLPRRRTRIEPHTTGSVVEADHNMEVILLVLAAYESFEWD